MVEQDSWQPEIDRLRELQAAAREMGGAAKVDRQHAQGRLTVRERLERLVDERSFAEIGSVSGSMTLDADGTEQFQAANFVFGTADIDGRPVVVSGDDFTIRGGSQDAAIPAKVAMSERLANEYRLPIIRLIEGSGGGGSIKALEDKGHSFLPEGTNWVWVAANLGTVPVVSLALGSVAGIGAARVVASHYSVMVRSISHVFVAGPPLVAGVGEDVTKEELGGAGVHGRNGTVSDVVDSEQEAFDRTHRFLSYLPSSVYDLPPRVQPDDDPRRREEWLIHAIPRSRRRVYKIRPIIEAVVDRDSFFEMGAGWGQSIVTGLARLDGWPVAVLASDPMQVGGALTAAASDKFASFVELADTFHLPVVHLVDQPGFAIGTQAERESAIRHGARALTTVVQSTVPWCAVLLRRTFGVGGLMNSNPARVRYRAAWPSGDWGALPMEGGIEAAYRAELDAADDREAKRAEIVERLEAIRSPMRTAMAFGVEDIIDPRDTRPFLCRFANLAAPLRTPGQMAWTMRG